VDNKQDKIHRLGDKRWSTAEMGCLWHPDSLGEVYDDDAT